jgi:SAM-dependent methyltransferase
MSKGGGLTSGYPGRAEGATMSEGLEIRQFQRDLMEVAERYRLYHCRSLISIQQFLPAYNLVRKHVPVGGRVLDWGAGNGHFSYFLMRSGYKTSGFGFDDVPEVCSASECGEYDYRRGTDPIRLPFDNHYFDAVLSIGVLEHVRETGGNETASLREIKRILKPDGVLICSHFPNKFSWIEFLARCIGRPSHRFTYTHADVLRLTRDAGLRVVEMGRAGALPRNVWSGDALRTLGNWHPAVRAYQLTDKFLATFLSKLCQSYWFVANAEQLP